MTIALARSGFHVLVAGRSESKVDSVVRLIRAEGGSADGLVFDLGSLDAVLRAARAVRESDISLDVLVNNAGIGIGNGLTGDGFEVHWAVNHIGPFLLTQELGPVLMDESRVVTVSSAWHFRARELQLDQARSRSWSPLGLGLYATTKTANVLFTRELARRRPGLHTYAVHPGLVDTGLFPRWVKPFIGSDLRTPEEGADTVVWCASSEEVAGQTGLYYSNRQVRSPSPLAADDDVAAELWEKSEHWVN